MKCPLSFLFVLLLVPAAARADEFSEFRIPRHQWYSLGGSLSGSASSSESDDIYGRTRHSDFGGWGTFSFRSSLDSDLLRLAWGLAARAQGTRNDTRTSQESVQP